MKRLPVLGIGCVLLSVWAAMNLIPSAWILIETMARGGHTPALYLILSESEVEALDADVLATLDSIAVFANGLNIAFCVLALFVIWRGLYRRHRWAFWGLLAGFACALLAGIGGDFEVGFAAPWVNLISGGILAAGFAMAAAGLRRDDPSRVEVP